MHKILILIIPAVFLSCKNDKEEKDYPYRNGVYEEYYDIGKLKLKTEYLNGIISDTVFRYYENGKLKEKGLIKNNLKTGWWNYYSSNGKLKNKNEYRIINDSLYKNQTIFYYDNGKINYKISSFFEIELPDTLSLGKNAGKLYYHSNFNDSTERFLYVIIENEYSNNTTIRDTFINDNNYTRFGVFAEKVGLKTVRGAILEKMLYKKIHSKDSAELTFKLHKKYFEKEVYVQGTID